MGRGPQHGNTDWDRLFAFYDRDGDGELCYVEFKTAMRRDAQMTPALLPDVGVHSRVPVQVLWNINSTGSGNPTIKTVWWR